MNAALVSIWKEAATYRVFIWERGDLRLRTIGHSTETRIWSFQNTSYKRYSYHNLFRKFNINYRCVDKIKPEEFRLLGCGSV
jgi:hypothetical protein